MASNLTAISDGEPITYALLNQIIEQVNSLTVAETTQKQTINVYGETIQTAENDVVNIAVGQQPLTVSAKGGKQDVPIKFPKNVEFKAVPFVTATVVDYKGEGQGISFANVTIIQINKGGFTARVRLVSELKKDTEINIHYIAIGSGSS